MKNLITIFFMLLLTNLSAQISWGIKTKSESANDLYTPYHYFLETINYFKNGEKLWSINAPKPYMNRSFERTKEEVDYNKYPNKPSFLSAEVLETERLIIVPFHVALYVIDKKTGELKEAFPFEIDNKYLHLPYQEVFWFDDGAFTIACNENATTYKEQMAANFLKIKGKYILHFNGKHLFILNKKSGKLVYKVPILNRWEKKAMVYATAKWDKLTVSWEGIIYR